MQYLPKRPNLQLKKLSKQLLRLSTVRYRAPPIQFKLLVGGFYGMILLIFIELFHVRIQIKNYSRNSPTLSDMYISNEWEKTYKPIHRSVDNCDTSFHRHKCQLTYQP